MTRNSAQRNPVLYGLAAMLVIGLGLLWRSDFFPLSHGVSKYGGDALWALVVFLCTGIVFCRSSTTRVVIIAVCFSWGIEFLQLYQAPWINSMRATLLGSLILGSTFNAPDLFAYLLGIFLGGIAEYFFHHVKRHKLQAK